jgi:hypothetical protein
MYWHYDTWQRRFYCNQKNARCWGTAGVRVTVETVRRFWRSEQKCPQGSKNTYYFSGQQIYCADVGSQESLEDKARVQRPLAFSYTRINKATVQHEVQCNVLHQNKLDEAKNSVYNWRQEHNAFVMLLKLSVRSSPHAWNPHAVVRFL